MATIATTSTALAAGGAPDVGFGTAGKVVTDLGGADWSGAVAVAPAGSVVVAGASDADIGVVRYDASGRLDFGFGGDGTVVTDLGAEESAAALAVQRDGKILAAGSRSGDLVVVRYAADGTLDRSFDADGIVVADLGGRESAAGLLLRPDGRIVVAGSSRDRLVLARYLPDGRVDRRFGRNGFVVRRAPGVEWRSAAAGPGGTIVVAGRRALSAPVHATAPAVARFLADGRPDRTFSGDGLVLLAPRPHWAGAVAVAVQRDGRIVLGTHGHTRATSGFALVRFRRDGGLDRSFGDAGTRVSPLGYGIRALAIDARGRIVAAGETTSLRDFMVARYLADGALDRSFEPFPTDFGARDTPFALALQRDGKIVVAGASGAALSGDVAVVRYLAAG